MADTLGGRPSKGTRADRRLKENKPVKRRDTDGNDNAAATVDRWAGRRLIAQAQMARWQSILNRAAGRALADRKRRALAVTRSGFAAITADASSVDPFDAATWGDAVDAEITPAIRTILAEVTTDAARMLDLNASDLPPFDVAGRAAKLSDWYNRLGEQVSSDLQEALTQSAGLGESISEAAARIDAVFGSASSRSTVIARTELSAAANMTALEYGRAVNDTIPLDKTWLGGSCPDCVELDGETVGINETFSTGDDSPPLHPSCVCSLALDPAADATPESDGEPPPDEETPTDGG